MRISFQTNKLRQNLLVVMEKDVGDVILCHLDSLEHIYLVL